MNVDYSFAHNYSCDPVDELPTIPIQVVEFSWRAERQGMGSRTGVRFSTSQNHDWIGWFYNGDLALHSITGVFSCPDATKVCVIAQGQGYVVDTQNPLEYEVVSVNPITDVYASVATGQLILADPWSVCAYSIGGLEWTTGDLGMGGLKLIAVEGSLIRAEMDSGGEIKEILIDVATGLLVNRKS